MAVNTVPTHGEPLCDMSESVRASASRSAVTDPEPEGSRRVRHRNGPQRAAELEIMRYYIQIEQRT